MLLKKLIKRILLFGLNAFEVDAIFFGKNKAQDMVLFDKNQLSYFYNSNKRKQLYYEALERTKMEWSDNLSKQLRFYSLQQMIEQTLKKNLKADFAECGCWRGHSSFLISTLIRKHGLGNRFHIFDSFEGGLSGKSSHDRNERFSQSEKDIQIEKEIFSSTETYVQNVLADFDFVKTYKGWIPDRFADVKDRTFSFVHLDVDLYQPTLDSLEFFFPRLIKGGCVVVDDYGSTQFPGAKTAVDNFLLQKDFEMFYEVPNGGCFIIK